MFKFNTVYREEEGGDQGGGGGSTSPTMEELEAQITELTSSVTQATEENNRLNGKITEANKHNKEAQRLATEASRKKAEAENDFEQLYKSSETERRGLSDQLSSLSGQISSEKVHAEAMKIAVELADGANAEILSDYIAKRLKFTDEGIKVTDNSGNLTVSTLDDLKREFEGSAKYSSLIKGRRSNGGSAPGGTNGGSAASKIISRAEFSALNPMARAKHFKDGGKIVDQ